MNALSRALAIAALMCAPSSMIIALINTQVSSATLVPTEP